MSPLAFLAIALAALVLINAAATRRVLRSDEFSQRKALLVMGVWIVPFMGAFLAFHHLPAPAQAAARQQAAATPTTAAHATVAPTSIELAGSAPFDVLAHLHTEPGGFVQLDWQAVDEWATRPGAADPVVTEAINQARRAWLLHLRDALGGRVQPHPHLHESEDVYILSALEPAVARATAQFVSKTRQRILKVLDGVAHFHAGEKSVVLVLDSEDTYYEYVAQFYPDAGEFAFSGGMFIHHGCPHFVVVQADLAAIEPVIAHELTHSALSYLRLPTWLDEGLAVNTEHRLAGAARGQQTPQAMHQRHQRFWTAERVQEFWTGDSFHRTDDGNQLSYDLARIAVAQMAAGDWAAFTRFVTTASRSDAGAAAARDALGVDLGEYIGTLVQADEPARWAPRPDAWHAAHPATAAASLSHRRAPVEWPAPLHQGSPSRV
ncbi:hypothetical protein ASF11_12245 [Acidovorax sp. Leaf76]|uniref:hypothetical protein n=1 Tax=unclassified Acidovorax TaxID=2684926 RepID=UPI0006FD31BC|nr:MULTISPECIES: hypothetical protein [unclassified Acidovorax]KQO14417.1 hypothetical protein ASF11_12245 [Acidovorax sp. Leaf76]KQO38130.1 hypothetical protein ASF19_20370 [Acidovorax sp. Leaf84]KQS29326.1 hypothetical protein ASG27_14080 [Acidovorax sp. Leaf191]